VQVIDTVEKRVVHTFSPGKAVLHMEFTPRGEEVWLSARDSNRVTVVDTASFGVRHELSVDAPSGIFFTSRGQRIGF
jgi:protein NirF